MNQMATRAASTGLLTAAVISLFSSAVWAEPKPAVIKKSDLGPRPYYLVDQMNEGTLKDQLQSCKGPFKSSDFSIGHRGAPLQFPEHTRESYVAAARMGAGILECDVTFTSDAQLVCRHDQCDLHTTTNILSTPLASTCDVPFTPAQFDAGGNLISAATARCCASDLTLAQFKSLEGKMDASDNRATTVEQYQKGTAPFRTDLYATGATLLSHVEAIELFESLGAKHTPELKSGAPADVNAVFGSQKNYAQALVDDYLQLGVNPDRVWPQSFNLDDVLYWLENTPAFGQQAVFLDGGPVPRPGAPAFLADLAQQGVKIVAPPIPMLLTLNAANEIIPSDYAIAAQDEGLDIITWSLERSGRIQEDVLEGGNTFYYQTVLAALDNDGDILRVLDVLAQQVGVIGVFSDWPATTTFYANCTGIK